MIYGDCYDGERCGQFMAEMDDSEQRRGTKTPAIPAIPVLLAVLLVIIMFVLRDA